MNLLSSLSFLALIPFCHHCSNEQEPAPQQTLFIKTVDGGGKPVSATIVYESLNCEYDFVSPSTAHSDALGITALQVAPGDFQFYAEGFIPESYHCFNYDGTTQTITVYAAPIPTYVQTAPGASVTWFRNTSGNCDYESTPGTLVTANASGKATLYLPPSDIYKIQVNGVCQCFQPDQDIHTLDF